MKRLFVLLFTVILCVSMIGCSTTAETSKLEKIQADGVLVVYTDPNFAPFEFMGASGIEGVDIEIAKAIAEELGVTVKFTESNFDAILMAIKGGKGDIAVSGFTITEERKGSVDFSDPYIESVQYLILPEDSDLEIFEDLAGKKVGVAKGYTGQFLMEYETSVDEDGIEGVLYKADTEIKIYNSAMEATLDLLAGRLDAVVMDEYVAKNIASTQKGVKTHALSYASGDLAAEEYGVVVPKGNEDLLVKINEVIKRLKNEDKIREWVIQFSS